MHDVEVYVKDFLYRPYVQKVMRIPFIFPTGFTLLNILFLFPLLITQFQLSSFMVFDAISFNTDLLIKVLICILVELIDLVNCYNFFSQTSLLRCLTYLLGSTNHFLPQFTVYHRSDSELNSNCCGKIVAPSHLKLCILTKDKITYLT